MNESTASKLDEFRLRWTVGRKIGALVGGLLLLLLVGSLNSLRRASEVGEGLREVADVDIPLLAEMREIESSQHERHIALIRGYQERLRSSSSGEKAWDTQLARFEEETRAIERTFAAAESSIALAQSLSGSTAAKYTQVEKELADLRVHAHDYETKARQFFTLLTKGDTDDSAAALLDELERTSDEIDTDYHALEEDLEEFADGRLAEAEAREVAALNLNLIMSGAGFVIGLLLFVWLMHRLTRSISAVTQRAEAVARGELNLEPLAIDSTDELGRLSAVFNQMSETLASQVRDTRAAIETLNSAASQIVAAAKEQSATAKEQAATIQEITASMEEIGQSGTQISERAAQVSGRAEEASQAGNTGRDAMRETNESMGSIRTQIEEVAENIVTLSEKTQAVGEIISAVNEIAEQSNLLALNAAIEAAAAGEQGSRFSVVAGEIKNLSDQAKDSTGQVGRILGEIQKGINTAVMLTEEAVKRAEVGKAKAASTERTIGNLVVSTQESVEAFQQIVAGSNQQQIGITQTSQGMHDIRQAAEQTAVGTSQLEKAAVDLTSLGRQLHEVVDQYTL